MSDSGLFDKGSWTRVSWNKSVIPDEGARISGLNLQRWQKASEEGAFMAESRKTSRIATLSRSDAQMPPWALFWTRAEV